MTPRRLWLHRAAIALSFSTVCLLLAGAFVTSTGSGLAVPDWPLSYGMVFPPMVGGIFYEHGHRMVATFVGFLSIVVAILFAMWEPRRWVRRLAWAAVVLVCLQGSLGGLTVILLLPPSVSVLHAFTAQVFFCLTVLLALASSRFWVEQTPRPFSWKDERGAVPLRYLAPGITLLFFAQLTLGAVMRHNQAALAIPDFPLVFGGIFPPSFPFPIAIHFAHRVGAYSLVVLVTWVALRVHRAYPERLDWIAATGALGGLVSLQVLLGALVVWLKRPPGFASIHLVVGALCLATSVVLTAEILRAARTAKDGRVPA